jgi:hypothetical protein
VTSDRSLPTSVSSVVGNTSSGPRTDDTTGTGVFATADELRIGIEESRCGVDEDLVDQRLSERPGLGLRLGIEAGGIAEEVGEGVVAKLDLVQDPGNRDVACPDQLPATIDDQGRRRRDPGNGYGDHQEESEQPFDDPSGRQTHMHSFRFSVAQRSGPGASMDPLRASEIATQGVNRGRRRPFRPMSLGTAPPEKPFYQHRAMADRNFSAYPVRSARDLACHDLDALF